MNTTYINTVLLIENLVLDDRGVVVSSCYRRFSIIDERRDGLLSGASILLYYVLQYHYPEFVGKVIPSLWIYFLVETDGVEAEGLEDLQIELQRVIGGGGVLAVWPI